MFALLGPPSETRGLLTCRGSVYFPPVTANEISAPAESVADDKVSATAETVADDKASATAENVDKDTASAPAESVADDKASATAETVDNDKASATAETVADDKASAVAVDESSVPHHEAVGFEEEKAAGQEAAEQEAEAELIASKLPDVPTSKPGEEEHAGKEQKRESED